ncbi:MULTISPECIES: hypothetical protein [unclassified Streptomyces]|uniref:hypothetical protein n=1 Tax=unclassified Streptomyces TaxID=2593676 RepID=UPI0022B658E3|nr:MULTISPECIES: hypothetical protein [unclassified Streptomyces]MCZ7416981.1 hypothetical protein [Streptomyces sp. WMMC897]MCZ7433189.1 hypothetical protein [Streptomyces sp. WMMC1477]
MTSHDDARRPTGPGDDPGRASRPPSLPEILDAAAAPPAAEELHGEEAAVAAFRAARDTASASPAAGSQPSPPRGWRRRGSGPWRRGTVLGLAGAALLAGGVTTTAVSGGLPFAPSTPATPESGAPAPKSPAATSGPAAPGDSDADGSPPGSHPAEGDRTAPGRTRPPEPAPSRTDEARLAGLCHSYLQLPEHRRAQALTTPGFQPLVTAAGGPGAVEGYCHGQPPAAPVPPGSPLPSRARTPDPAPGDAAGTPSASAPPGDAERATDARQGGPGTPSEPDDARRGDSERDRGQGRP